MGLHKRAKLLSDNQQKAVLQYLSTKKHSKRNQLMFLLSVKAALRAKEIGALKWSHITTSEGVIGDTINLPNVCSKGNSGRVIPISKDLKEALICHFGEGKPLDNTVIVSQKGYSMSNAVVANFFFKLYSDLGMDGCSSHSGRRTAATKWAKTVSSVGGSLRDVQTLLGHSSLQITQCYVDVDTEAQQKLVNL